MIYFKLAKAKKIQKNQIKVQIVAFFSIFWPFLTLLLPDVTIQVWNLSSLAIFIIKNTFFKNTFWKWIKNALPTSVQPLVRFWACPIVPLSRDNEWTSVPLFQKVALSCSIWNSSSNWSESVEKKFLSNCLCTSSVLASLWHGSMSAVITQAHLQQLCHPHLASAFACNYCIECRNSFWFALNRVECAQYHFLQAPEFSG